jgi:hypothetical protein
MQNSMNKIKTMFNTFDSRVDKVLGQITRPVIIKGVVYIIVQIALILYITQVINMLPQNVLNIMNNDFFKLFMLAMVLWTAQNSPSISILLALAFIITTNYATKGKVWESFDEQAPFISGMTLAPSQDSAIQDSTNSLNTLPTVVSGISTNQNTINITPSIVNTTQGPMVNIPSVVISPTLVQTPNGQTISVTPNVTTLSVNSNTGSSVLQDTGCFPIRNSDISQVLGIPENTDNTEDYAEINFTPMPSQ